MKAEPRIAYPKIVPCLSMPFENGWEA